MPPLGGGVRRNIAMTFDTEKLEWLGYPMVKKSEGVFIRFDRMYESDRRDRHRMRATAVLA